MTIRETGCGEHWERIFKGEKMKKKRIKIIQKEIGGYLSDIAIYRDNIIYYMKVIESLLNDIDTARDNIKIEVEKIKEKK